MPPTTKTMHLCYFILYEMHEKQNQNRRRAPRFLCVPRTKDEHLNSECLWIRPATDSPQPFWQAEAVYIYAKISLELELPDPRTSDVLMDSLANVWDGSEEHARRLAELLFAHRRACM
jgi:hypothetical protein